VARTSGGGIMQFAAEFQRQYGSEGPQSKPARDLNRTRMVMGHGRRKMMELRRSKDCGNSPKNKLVEDIAIALETGDIEFLSSILAHDAEWGYVGGTAVATKGILDHVDTLSTPTELSVRRVMSHGKVGAANGTVAYEGGSRLQFCHVLEFTSVKC